MEFVKSLKEQRLGKRQAIFGDGTNYHKSQEFREYLMLINQEKPEEKWCINCLKFAPNAPQQNPVEDIWLQRKNFMIAFYHLCSSFKQLSGYLNFLQMVKYLIFLNFFSMEFCHNYPEDSYIDYFQ